MGSVERLMIDKKTGQVAYTVLSFGGVFGPWQRGAYDPLEQAGL